eukprot:Phypoly_transcript_11825.p1 GENE.Phypoly_transcript_11825~~Phypoly_transcript_11825.p1  ORF type:complete len:262 (+),score=53.89 Phypoly_transcript_11825:186-971(+)
MDFDQEPPAFDDIERLPVHILSSTPPPPSLATSRPAIRSRRTAVMPSLSTSPSSIPIDIPTTTNNTSNNNVNIITDTTTPISPSTCTPASPPSSPVLAKLSVKERKQHPAPSSALSKEIESISAPEDITTPPAIDISDFECPLCFQVYLQPVTTPCGHVFCKQCLFRAFQHSCSCPLCRFKIDPSLNQKYSVNIVLMNVIEKYFPKEHRERVSQEESIEKTEEPLKNERDENARPNSPSNWACLLPSLRSTCTVLLSCGGF